LSAAFVPRFFRRKENGRNRKETGRKLEGFGVFLSFFGAVCSGLTRTRKEKEKEMITDL